MTRNLGGWAERGAVVRQVEEVPKNPCKSSTGAVLNHSTTKGPRDAPEICDYPPRRRGNRGNNMKILNRCVFIPLPINQVTWQPFSCLAPGRRGGHIPLWEGECQDTGKAQTGRKREGRVPPPQGSKEAGESEKKQHLPFSAPRRESLESFWLCSQPKGLS